MYVFLANSLKDLDINLWRRQGKYNFCHYFYDVVVEKMIMKDPLELQSKVMRA